VVMATGNKIGLRDLPASVRENRSQGNTRSLYPVSGGGKGSHLNLQETEHRLIMKALEESKGNRTKAAERLGISRRTLHRRLKQLNIPSKNQNHV